MPPTRGGNCPIAIDVMFPPSCNGSLGLYCPVSDRGCEDGSGFSKLENSNAELDFCMRSR